MSIYFWNSTASKLVFAIFILLLTIFMEATGVINQSHRANHNDGETAREQLSVQPTVAGGHMRKAKRYETSVTVKLPTGNAVTLSRDDTDRFFMLLIMGEMKILKRERDFRKHPNCKERKKCRPASSTGKAYPTIQATSTGVPKFKTAAPTVLPPSLHSARQTVPPPSSTMMPSILETGSQTLLRTPITGSQTLHGNSQNLLSVTSSQNLLDTVLQAYTTTTTPILTVTAATPILTATSTSSIPVFTDTTASPIIATTNASSATWSYMISQIMPPTALCTQTGSDPVTSSCFQIASYAQSQVSPLPTRTTPFKVQQTQMPSFNNDWTTIVLDSTSASSEPSIASSTNETMTLDISAANTFGSMPTAIETATAVPVGSAAMATRNSRFGVLLQSIVLSLLLAKI